MKLKVYLLLTPFLLLISGILHPMNLAKPSPQLVSMLFNNMQPSSLLKNNRTFDEERNEKFDALIKMLNPKVLTFIQNNPDDKTAQIINRSINLIASKMAFFIGENAPILNQDLLSQNSGGNPIHAFFCKSAKASRDTMVLLLPADYFLDRKSFLQQKFEQHAELLHKAFLRSIEQLGMTLNEIAYIDEGKILSDAQVEEMQRAMGMDILGVFSSKESFFKNFKTNIKKTKITDIIDEMADIKTAALLKNSELLQKVREGAVNTSFGISLDAALKILDDEQAGCSFNARGDFAFDCNNESQKMVYAIADHKIAMLQKVHAMMDAMHTTVKSFDIDEKAKKFFIEECEQTNALIERAQDRSKKLEIILPEDATIIGPRSYALSNLYGALNNMAKNKNDETAQRLVVESANMYKFVRMQE